MSALPPTEMKEGMEEIKKEIYIVHNVKYEVQEDL